MSGLLNGISSLGSRDGLNTDLAQSRSCSGSGSTGSLDLGTKSEVTGVKGSVSLGTGGTFWSGSLLHPNSTGLSCSGCILSRGIEFKAPGLSIGSS